MKRKLPQLLFVVLSCLISINVQAIDRTVEGNEEKKKGNTTEERTSEENVDLILSEIISISNPKTTAATGSPVSVSIVSSTNVSCFGFANGSITTSVSNGTMPYTYLWSSGATTANNTGLSAGAYTITVTDNGGATATASIAITTPTAATWTSSVSQNVSCTGGNDGSATISNAGGTTPYTYLWSSGATTATVTNLSAGTNTVTVTDANGCTFTESLGVGIAIDNTAPTITVCASTPSNISANGSCQGTAPNLVGNVTASDNCTSSPTITQSPASGATLGLGTTTITLTATDGSGNTATCTVNQTVIDNTAPTITVCASTPSNIAANGSCQGTAPNLIGSVTASDNCTSSPTITQSPASGATLGLGTTTITLTATDGSGNTATCTVNQTVIDNTAPTITVCASTPSNIAANGSCQGTAPNLIGSVTASDNCTSSPTITQSPASGATLGLGTTTITLTATDGSGNTATCTVNQTVIDNTAPMITACASTPPNIVANSSNQGAAPNLIGSVTASDNCSSSPTITQSPASGATLGLGTTTITLTATDGSGNTATCTVNQTVVSSFAVTATLDNNVSCNSFTDGGATASVMNGTMPYTYLWSNGTTSASITGVGAGTYTVTVTDNSGLTSSANVSITEPTLLVGVSIVDNNITCNGFTDGGATSSATGGTMPYTYAWNNGATTASITGVAAGTYSVTITDANGCTDSSSSIITEPAALVSSSVVDSMVSTFGGADGGATASGTGGTMPYTYSWNNGATTASITGVVSGTYSVTLTDNNGCTDSASVFINQPPAITASINLDSDVSCNGLSDGGATAIPIGGVMPYSYVWSNGATTASITGLSVGTYTVTITENTGATATDQITISEPAVFAVNLRLDSNVSCNGGADGSATVSNLIPIHFQGFENPTGDTVYSISTLSVGGFSGVDYETSTSEGRLRLNAGSGFYHTGNYAATIDARINSAFPEPVNYLITTFNMAGEAASTDLRLSFWWSDHGEENDINDRVWLRGDTTDSWIEIANLNSINPSIGVYTFFSIDLDSVISANSQMLTTNFQIRFGQQDNFMASSPTASDGYTFDDITISKPDNSLSYAWSNGTTNQTASGLAAGTYTVTVTNGNGCTAVNNITITEPAMALAVSIAPDTTTCNGGNDASTRANASGGTSPYSYNWSTGGSSANLSSLSAGMYTVTITDNNGCTLIDSVAIAEPGMVTIVMADTMISCNGASDGEIHAQVSLGTAPYTYLWSTTATTPSLLSLSAGTYTVTVTDANGCSNLDSTTIVEPTALVVAMTVDSNATCNGFSDAGVTAGASGGTSPYTYIWNNTAITASITGVTAGTYIVTVTDANGCSQINSSVVTEPTALTVGIQVDSMVSCNGLNDAGITAQGSGGTGAYTYAWNTGSSMASLSGIGAGSYTVTVSDANNCTTSQIVVITEPTVIVAVAAIDSNVSCNGASDGGATVTVGGGTAPYTYVWSNAAATASITGVAAGSYTVTVSDANGCTSTSNATITEPSVLVATTQVDSVVNCNGGNNGGLSASAAGGTAPYTYTWSNAAVTSSITGLGAGTYTITVTDANGCTELSTGVVTEPLALSVSFTIDSAIVCNGGTDGELTAMIIGGTQPYLYAWSNNDSTASIVGLSAGKYTLTLTDANNCTLIDSVTLSEPSIPTSSISVTSCDSYTWIQNNQEYTSTGVYTDTVQTALGCDSVISLNLTITNSTSSTQSARACFSYTWLQNNATYTQSGSYSDTVPNLIGCDSIITLNLIIDTADVSVIRNGFDLIALANGTGITYQWLDCMNGDTAITGATSNTYSVIKNGQYSVVITQNGCRDTSLCVDVFNVGLGEQNEAKASLNVYPNPTRGMITLEVSGIEFQSIRLQVRSMVGKLVHEGQLNSAQQQLDLSHLDDGIYFIQIGEAMKKVIVTK